MENQLQVLSKQTAVTIKQPDRVFTLNDLNNNLPTLTVNESRILDARQRGYAFLDMSEKESQTAATGIIFKVSVICGCQLPTHDAHINALESEFLNFLTEFGFGSLTVEEVLLAFRLNAAHQLEERVEVFGAIFNIDYAGKVLKQYRDYRWRLDRKLSEKHREIDADKKLEEEANRRRVKVMVQYDKYLSGADDLDLADCYMQLCDDGAFYSKKFDEEFMPVLERGWYGDAMERLHKWGKIMEAKFEAGRKAVMVLFKAMKDSDKLEIYTKDLKLIHFGFQLPEEPKTVEIE